MSMSLAGVRALLQWRESCDGDEDGEIGACKGWFIDDDPRIVVCDQCTRKLNLSDDDVALLPEAQAALLLEEYKQRMDME